MASSFWHMHHGPKIREWRRAKGEATGTEKVPEMRLAGHRELREEVVLDATQGIVIGKKGRSGRYSDVLRLSQGNRELRKGRLIALRSRGIWSTRLGRQPA